MKNFKYPLQIQGSKEELDSFLSPLTELGYRKSYDFGTSDPKYLVTNFGNLPENNGVLDFVHHFDPRRITVYASNRELVLALAAVVDDDKFYPGEYVTPVRDSWAGEITFGRLYKVIDYDRPYVKFIDVDGDENGLHPSNLRKATKEEIISWFENPTEEVSELESEDSSFLKVLHAGGNDFVKEALEIKFPNLFPRPAFRAGDKINVEVEHGILHLMIISSLNTNAIRLVNLLTGKYGTSVFVEDFNAITEGELLRAGEDFKITLNNYTKVDCSVPPPFSSNLTLTSGLI
jgi:hypothetical protein